ncbi:uncharacterized protein A1O9_01757 [Exophiala aquamarina CBS 119918]|uniref:Uncharacterized protein n=1 Tax=Exophiala aquamarina CBS 119918 TaxID=1182545 RepID=A0A072PUQ3_9EURO|nr:uncharacterized protein A1O9_01757 [Exophiala aquamarina CBS 119918]KEF63779.1 hypothetical protein A1O9_01757 [Exophiala aquamarina CBS 119918]
MAGRNTGRLLSLNVAILFLHLLISTISATPFDSSSSVVDTSIYHPTTLITISTAAPNTNFDISSITFFDHALKAREDEAEADKNDWYLNCAGDHKLSLQFCEQLTYDYFCRLHELNHGGHDRNIMCEAACTCKKGHPTPGCSYVRGRCYDSQAETEQFEQFLKDPINKIAPDIDDLQTTHDDGLQARTENPIFDTQNQEADTFSSGPVLSALETVEQDVDQPLDDSANPDLLPLLRQRDTEQALHDFALVCIQRDWTNICAGNPYKYSCDQNGRVSYRRLDLYCDAICGCVDLVAKPRCFRHGKWLTTCLAKLDSREIAGNEHSSLQVATENIAETPPTPGDLPMYCGIDGTADTRLTQFCSEHQYHCTLSIVDGHAKSFLRSNSETVDQCANNCHCVGSAVRAEFESHHAMQQIEERSDAEVEQSFNASMSQSTGLSVFYCIKHHAQTYIWEIDFRLIEFCQNENFVCAGQSPNDSPGFPPVAALRTQSAKYPKCFERCYCVHFENHNTVWKRSEEIFDMGVEGHRSIDSGIVSGEDVPNTSEARDYVLTCVNGKDDLAAFCARFWAYHCSEIGVLHHDNIGDPDDMSRSYCDISCRCLDQRPHEEDKDEAGTGSGN